VIDRDISPKLNRVVMDLEELNGFSFRNLTKFNILLGKNGCGKSFILKRSEEALNAKQEIGKVRYISPERGGILSYDPGVEQSIANNASWLSDTRRKNQLENFRQQSVALFRRLELLILRQIEREHLQDAYEPVNFSQTVDELNTLLDRVKLIRDDQQSFIITVRDDDSPAKPGDISSGEAELISLGIEFLAFVTEAEVGKENYLLVDEPDVHLHPDLQDRLAKFLVRVVGDKPMKLVMATHSTALLAGMSESDQTSVAFMKRGDRDIIFKTMTDVDRAILPIFGAHPLSNVFNQAPVLLVEGEDDSRVWQQAVRSSNGRIRVYPCDVGGVDKFPDYENEVSNIISAVYDDACGYSLRDRDLHPEQIENVGPVIRMRLSCRAAENLMLSDQALALAGTDWPTFQEKLRAWIKSNAGHQYHRDVIAFSENGFDRKGHDLKDIRNILIGLMSNKPWEVLAGQAIAQVSNDNKTNVAGSLANYLGEKVCLTLL
jgi:predicted ATPase